MNASKPKGGMNPANPAKKRPGGASFLTTVLILCAVLFLAIGVWQGEAEIVFRKATNLCMECIGLG